MVDRRYEITLRWCVGAGLERLAPEAAFDRCRCAPGGWGVRARGRRAVACVACARAVAHGAPAAVACPIKRRTSSHATTVREQGNAFVRITCSASACTSLGPSWWNHARPQTPHARGLTSARLHRRPMGSIRPPNFPRTSFEAPPGRVRRPSGARATPERRPTGAGAAPMQRPRPQRRGTGT